jgi:uncharacterized membrane protein
MDNNSATRKIIVGIIALGWLATVPLVNRWMSLRLNPMNGLAWVVWNTYLAAIPVALALIIRWIASHRPVSTALNVTAGVVGIGWLLYLPNTCYLLTEWRHFLFDLYARNLYMQARVDPRLTMLLMKYTIFYFCYSGIGMLAFALAVRPVHRALRDRGATVWIYGCLLFLMLSVGVYLGLAGDLRYNSWDLITRPATVLTSALTVIGRPVLSAFIIGFAAFLWLAYTALDIFIDGLIVRYKETRIARKK